MHTNILKLKSRILKSKYGSVVVLFKYYKNFDIDTLNQNNSGSEITKLDTNFHTSFYDEELIEDLFSIDKTMERE